MNKNLTHKFLTLTLLVTSLLAPTAYAKTRTARATPTQAAAQQSAANHKQAATQAFLRTELFFGSAKPDGTAVTEAEWRRFLDQEITPRFPDGLTVLTGIGQFRNSSGMIIQERSMVLILLYPLPTWRSSSEKIEQIREAYKRAFQQESVLRADTGLPVWVSF